MINEALKTHKPEDYFLSYQKLWLNQMAFNLKLVESVIDFWKPLNK